MVDAYLFFCSELQSFFIGSVADPPLAAETELPARLEECFQALKSTLQVVVIDLAQEDDAQVIFETLNARGEPLLPSDLVRNHVFLRATRSGEDPEKLYHDYWRRFDDPFWREAVRQGRLSRPRSDLFLQHFLASQQGEEIPIGHLFVEYKFWIHRQHPFASVQEEVAALARQSDHFRRILDTKRDDVIYPLTSFLDCFDIRTAYPLLLHLFESELGAEAWRLVATMLESYLLRRAVCGLTTKNYNRVFLGLTRTLRRTGATTPAVERIRSFLAELKGQSNEWPADGAFGEAWRTNHVYRLLQPSKIVHILRRLNDTYAGTKTEKVLVDGPLSIEHILPQGWLANWPLPDGSSGMTQGELAVSVPEAARAEGTRARNALLQTFGNLTLVTQALNSALSNGKWKEKKEAVFLSSVLPLNLPLRTCDAWDESTIKQRSEELFERALTIWPGPQVTYGVS